MITRRLIKALGTVAVAVFIIFYVTPAFRGDIIVASDIFIGPVRVHFYGLFLAVGFFVAWLVALRHAERFGIEKRLIEQTLLWAVIGAFIGARMYFAVFSYEHFIGNPLRVFAFWEGGLSLYGGIVGGALALLIFSKRKSVSAIKLFDLAAISLPLGQAIGRWGNFFNQEAFGLPTDLPWKMFVDVSHRLPAYSEYVYFHPTFLYESIWNFIVFIILLYLLNRVKFYPPGFFLGSYLILYPLGRFFVEAVRLDSVFIYNFRLEQLTSLGFMLAGGLVFYLIYANSQNQSDLEGG